MITQRANSTACSVHSGDAPTVYSVTPAVFGWKRDQMHITHLYEGRWGIVEMPAERSIAIDTDHEFQMVARLMARG